MLKNARAEYEGIIHRATIEGTRSSQFCGVQSVPPHSSGQFSHSQFLQGMAGPTLNLY